MDFSPGETLFYSGIVGMAIVAVISIIVIVVLSVSRKRLFRYMDDEYAATASPFSASTKIALIGCLLSFCIFCSVFIWALYVTADASDPGGVEEPGYAQESTKVQPGRI